MSKTAEAKPQEAKVQELAPLAPAVHGVFEGVAVCGFNRKTPGEWPDGQTWSDWMDFDHVSCLKCREWGAKKLGEMTRVRGGFRA